VLREGQTFEGIRVLEVRECEAIVEVPHYRKTLRIEKGRSAEPILEPIE